MGNYSWLVTTRNNAEGCKIDWDSMDTNLLFKDYHLQDEYKKDKNERCKTLAEMAEIWDDTKFCSYFDEPYIMALQEFCRHLKPCGSHPRLYYDYEGFDQLWCLEFVPGTDIINWAVYNFHKEVKDAIPYPKELEECEHYTKEIQDIEEEYSEKMEAFRKSVMETLPERDGWKFQRLVHREVSDAEALQHFIQMMYT
jgi:hypothetical protein